MSPGPHVAMLTVCADSAGFLSAHRALRATSLSLRFLLMWLKCWSMATGPQSLHPQPASAAGLVPAACCLTAQLQLVASHHPKPWPAQEKWYRI